MHKLTSISLIQQWHSTKHFKMFLCLNCPILGELQYLTRDLKKLHIKVNFLLNVYVLEYQDLPAKRANPYVIPLIYSPVWQWGPHMWIVFCWAAIPRAVGLLLLHHLNIIWTTCLTSQQLGHVISPEERLTHRQNIIIDSISYNLSENTSHFSDP